MITVIVGGQWGDEAKAGVADFISEDFEIFVRYNGGGNAGNTVVLPSGERLVFRHLPSGGLKQGAVLVLSRGTCIDPNELTKEILNLRKFNEDFTVLVDENSIVVEARHIEEDKGNQVAFSSVGTGVGPANADRMRRTARVMKDVPPNNLWRFIDTGEYLNDMADNGKNILFIGAHGTELDIFFGEYPYVTTSSCTSASIHQAGVHPSLADEIVLCVKAYSTRVGQGKFNDVDDKQMAHEIREKGCEYGSVSGRPRRIGWIDLKQLKRSVRINRPTTIALTMVDVLAGFDTIGIWNDQGELEHIPGWNMKDIEDYISHRACNAFSLFLTKIELATKCTVGIISYGSEKDKKVRI